MGGEEEVEEGIEEGIDDKGIDALDMDEEVEDPEEEDAWCGVLEEDEEDDEEADPEAETEAGP